MSTPRRRAVWSPTTMGDPSGTWLNEATNVVHAFNCRYRLIMRTGGTRLDRVPLNTRSLWRTCRVCKPKL